MSTTTSSKDIRNLSPFGQTAVALDRDFVELEDIGKRISLLEIDSDNDFERGKLLLAKFAECGQRVSAGVQGFAKALEEVRSRAEQSARGASEKATEIQKRHDQQLAAFEKFQALSEKVRQLGAEMAELKKPEGEKLTEKDRHIVAEKLASFGTKLVPLINEAQALKSEAEVAKMKKLSRDADALGQSLLAARKKLGTAEVPTTLH